jgi:hypothetical protein
MLDQDAIYACNIQYTYAYNICTWVQHTGLWATCVTLVYVPKYKINSTRFVKFQLKGVCLFKIIRCFVLWIGFEKYRSQYCMYCMYWIVWYIETKSRLYLRLCSPPNNFR